MTRHKKNKQKPTPAHHNNNTDTQPAGAAEEILEEVVEVKELLTKTKQKLRESDSLFGYLLSKKWLGSWKSYTGFDALAKSTDDVIQMRVQKTRRDSVRENLQAR